MWPFIKKPNILVRVHTAYFNNIMELSHEPYYFINILNIDKSRDIVISDIRCHHWPKNTTVYQSERPLPVKVTPGEQWETWISLDKIGKEAYEDFYITFSTDKRTYTCRSTRRTNVPNSGTVPGGK